MAPDQRKYSIYSLIGEPVLHTRSWGTLWQPHHRTPKLVNCLPNRASERGRSGEDPVEASWDSLEPHDSHTLPGGNFHENHHGCSGPRWWWLHPDPCKQHITATRGNKTRPGERNLLLAFLKCCMPPETCDFMLSHCPDRIFFLQLSAWATSASPSSLSSNITLS